MNIVCPAFNEEGTVPRRYTRDGENVSPPLRWTEVPAGTASLALIVDDPDAPRKTWVHWVAYNLPMSRADLPADASRILSSTFDQGVNDGGTLGYDGPSPPSGVHRYIFTLYALDAVLPLREPATKASLLKAMERHVLAEAKTIGRYARSR